MLNKEDWLSPMNKILWIKAFRERKKEVTIRDGRKFKIKYIGEKVRVSPVRGFSPLAWFPLEKVTNSAWLTESSDTVPAGSNVYRKLIDDFIESKENGVDAVEQWPALEGKLPETIRRGFNQARKDKDKVQVITRDQKVYLLRGDSDE
jgi:hypothetical protein